MDDKIHVAYLRLNLADEYNRHTGASIASVLVNCSRPVVVHIFSPETPYVSKESDNSNQLTTNRNLVSEIEKYHKLVEKYDAEIRFHTFQSLDWLNNCLDKGMFNMFTNHGLFRLFLPTLLPNVDWVFSLGSDVIVLTDLAKLQDSLPQEKPLAGANDYATIIYRNIFRNTRRYAEEHNISLDNYVCPDVLAFNLKYIRDNNLLPDRAVDYMKKYQDIRLSEMDVLNAIFRDNIEILPSRYHFHPYLKEIYPKQYSIIYNDEINIKPDCVIHFGGSVKPWNKWISQYDYEYWHYLSLTPWAAEIDIIYEMRNVIQTPEMILTNLGDYVWTKPFTKKLKLCLLIPLQLYGNLLKHYYRRYFKKEK